MDAWMRRLEGLRARSIPRKSIPEFDGEGDAYWWLICVEKHFEATGTQKTEELMEAVKGLRNGALRWWQCWRRRHPQASWGKFTVALLWRYKPEYRDVLPIPDDEEEESEDQDQEQNPEKVHESLEPEKKEKDEGQEIKTQNQKQGAEKIFVSSRSQVWSKLNVVRASKMIGITTTQRRRKRKNRGKGKTEERVGKIREKITVLVGWVSCLEPPPPPEPPDSSSMTKTDVTPVTKKRRTSVYMTGATPLRESEAETVSGVEDGNGIAEVKKRGSTEMVSSTAITNPAIKPSLTSSLFMDREAKCRRTCMLPEPPDRGGVAVCVRVSVTEMETGRIATLPHSVRIACVKKKQKTRSKSQFQRFGQVCLMGHAAVVMGSAQFDEKKQWTSKHKIVCNTTFTKRRGQASKCHCNNFKMFGYLSSQQWDPGGEIGL